MNKEKEIVVSIICLTYNHEKYISKTLDGLVNQKSDYRYEIIIHDDASTDNTVNIIRKYEVIYPDLLVPIYETENQYSKGVKITHEIMFPKVRGKYIAFCEGDDFWVDTHKIEKQVSILEESSCVATIGRVNVVNIEGDWTGGFFPRYRNMKVGEISGKEFISYLLDTRTISLLQFQISGLMVMESVYKNFLKKKPYYARLSKVGDFPLFLYIGTKGSVYYSDDIYSCYRTGVPGSWNTRNKDIDKKLNHLDREIEVVKAFDEYTRYVFKKDVEIAVKRREFLKYKALHNLTEMRKRKNDFRLMGWKEKFIEAYIFYFPQSEIVINKMREFYEKYKSRLLKWK